MRALWRRWQQHRAYVALVRAHFDAGYDPSPGTLAEYRRQAAAR